MGEYIVLPRALVQAEWHGKPYIAGRRRIRLNIAPDGTDCRDVQVHGSTRYNLLACESSCLPDDDETRICSVVLNMF